MDDAKPSSSISDMTRLYAFLLDPVVDPLVDSLVKEKAGVGGEVKGEVEGGEATSGEAEGGGDSTSTAVEGKGEEEGEAGKAGMEVEEAGTGAEVGEATEATPVTPGGPKEEVAGATKKAPVVLCVGDAVNAMYHGRGQWLAGVIRKVHNIGGEDEEGEGGEEEDEEVAAVAMVKDMKGVAVAKGTKKGVVEGEVVLGKMVMYDVEYKDGIVDKALPAEAVQLHVRVKDEGRWETNDMRCGVWCVL